MNKKRGVVISTADQGKTVNKSKSANINPLPPQVFGENIDEEPIQMGTRSGAIKPLEEAPASESHLQSEEPERMVNNAYYTYQDPDSMPHHESDRYEENEEYVIESMHKKKQLLQHLKKEEDKRKILQKTKPHPAITIKNIKAKHSKHLYNLPKNPQKAQSTKHGNFNNVNLKWRQKIVTVPRYPIPKQPKSNQIHKKSINIDIIKPKPLQFNIYMLDKAYMHSPHRRGRDGVFGSQTINIDRKAETNRSNLPTETMTNSRQKPNSKRLPYRFQQVF